MSFSTGVAGHRSLERWRAKAPPPVKVKLRYSGGT